MHRTILKSILNECTRINYRTDNTCFFRFAGHVDTIDISIHKGEWTEAKTPFFDQVVYFYKNIDIADSKKELTDLLHYLKGVK